MTAKPDKIDKLKLVKAGLESWHETLTSVIELVHDQPCFTSSDYYARKHNAKKKELDDKINNLQKEIEELKAQVTNEEQELSLRETKVILIGARIKDCKDSIKERKGQKIKKREDEAFKLVEKFFGRTVRHSSDSELPDDGGDEECEEVDEEDTPRRKRKRVVTHFEESEDDEEMDDDTIYEGAEIEDVDDFIESQLVMYSENVVSRTFEVESSQEFRDPEINPMKCEEDYYKIPRTSQANDYEGDKSTRAGRKRKQPEVEYEIISPKRRTKNGATGGRRSLGGDGLFGCKFCQFSTQYIQNLQRHVDKLHNMADAMEDSFEDDGNYTEFSLDPEYFEHSPIKLYPENPSTEFNEYPSIALPVIDEETARRQKWGRRKYVDVFETSDGTRYHRVGVPGKNVVYQCEECTYRTTYRNTVRKHIQKKHPHKFHPEELEDPSTVTDWSRFYSEVKLTKIRITVEEFERLEKEFIIKQEKLSPRKSDPLDNSESNHLMPMNGPKSVKIRKIYPARKNLQTIYSSFKQSCIELSGRKLPMSAEEVMKDALNPESFDEISFRTRMNQEGFNFDDVRELCLTVKKHTKKRFKTHTFTRESVLDIDHNIDFEELEEVLSYVTQCHNLEVLAISGVGSFHESIVETVLETKISSHCPKIEHFIFDDECVNKVLLDYVEELGADNQVKILEVKCLPQNENALVNAMSACEHLQAVYVEDITNKVMEVLVPRVSILSMSWLTRPQLNHFKSMAAVSSLTELHIEDTHCSIGKKTIKSLAESLLNLSSISMTGPLDIIHSLKYFNPDKLTHISWTAVPFDIEDDAAGFMVKEKPIEYWFPEDSEGCKHVFVEQAPKRTLSKRTRAPVYRRRMNNFKPKAEKTILPPPPPLILMESTQLDSQTSIPTIEECRLLKPKENEEDDTTEIDSQMTDVCDDEMADESPNVSKSSEEEFDVKLIFSSEGTDDEDPDLVLSDSSEYDKDRDYVSFRKHRVVKSFKSFIDTMGKNLRSFKVTISDKMEPKCFEPLATCLNLETLSVTALGTNVSLTPSMCFNPALLHLTTIGVIFRDGDLIDIMDNCPNLDTLTIEDSLNVTTSALRIVQLYAKSRAKNNTPSLDDSFVESADPMSDPTKIRVRISSSHHEEYNVIKVYDNLVHHFTLNKKKKIVRKY